MTVGPSEGGSSWVLPTSWPRPPVPVPPAPSVPSFLAGLGRTVLLPETGFDAQLNEDKAWVQVPLQIGHSSAETGTEQALP